MAGAFGPRMLTVDARELRSLEKQLGTASKAFRYALRGTLNDVAVDARRIYAQEAGSAMTLRDPWTVKSMRFDKVGAVGANMVSRFGSTESYMKDQEEGKDESKKGRYGVTLPAAAPGARKNRKKTPRRLRLNAITLGKRSTKGIRQVRNASAIAIAARAGGGFVFLETKKSKGIFQVRAGMKRGRLIRKIWDLSKSRVHVPKNTMMAKATKRAMAGYGGHYRENMIEQLHRHRVHFLGADYARTLRLSSWSP